MEMEQFFLFKIKGSLGSLFIIFFYKLFMITFSGFAFAGDRGIFKMEVSTDGGKPWKSAIVKRTFI